MNHEAIIAAAASAIFSAGGYAVTIRMLRRDLNGMGKKVRDQEVWRWGMVRTLIEESADLDQAKRFARLLPR